MAWPRGDYILDCRLWGAVRSVRIPYRTRTNVGNTFFSYEAEEDEGEELMEVEQGK
jgi:hypothetical protein